jgi:hypothetical protein
MQSACASVACPALHFTSRTYKKPNFREKKLNMKCAFQFSLQLLTETFLVLRIVQRDIIIKYVCLQIKYPSFSSNFNETWMSSTDFRKILKYQIPWKSVNWELICSVRTDMTSLFAVLPTRLKIDSHGLEPTSTNTTNFALARIFGRKSCTLQLSSREGTWRIYLPQCWPKKSVEPGWALGQSSVFCWHVITRPAHPISLWL